MIATRAWVSPRVKRAEPWARGKQSHSGRDLAHIVELASVDARLAGEDAASDDLLLESRNGVSDLLRSPARVAVIARGTTELRLRGSSDFAQDRLPLGLVDDTVGLRDSGSHRLVHPFRESRVLRRGGPVPCRPASLGRELADECDDRLHLFMAERDGAEHHFLGELLGLRLHHQHGAAGSGHDQIELRVDERRETRIEHVPPFRIPHASRSNRPIERNSGTGDRGRRADHRGNVRVDVRVNGHHRRHDLRFVPETLGKQRAHGPVDQPAGEDLLLVRPALPAKEAAGDPARGVGLFLIVDGEGKEVPVGVAGPVRNRGGEHDGIAERDHHRTLRLPGDFTGLDRQDMVAVLDALLDR